MSSKSNSETKNESVVTGEMVPVEMEIFSGGKQIDSQGRSRVWTENELDQIARDYDPGLHEAPAVLGHPEHDQPAYGWVQSLVRKGKSLMARLKVTPTLRDMSRKGLYKKRSVAFYHPRHPHNPRPGHWYLRHVGFLGAQPPAVKGLPDVSFRDENGNITVEFDRKWGPEALQTVLQRLQGWLEENRRFRPEEYEFQFQGPADISITNHEEGPMSFKERVKVFLNRAVDTMPEEESDMTCSYSEDEMKARVEEAVREAREATLAEFAEEQKKIEAKNRFTQQKCKVAEFCEMQKKSGKLLPAWEKAGLVPFLEGLAYQDEAALEFSEGRNKQTPFEWMCSFLESLPQTIHFQEAAGRTKDTNADDLPASQILIKLAGKKAREENMTFPDALRAVAAEHPDLVAEYQAEN